ncbi:hypothetical protein BGX34_010593 [Mortierella sp. NVP85]|nr:hypothetical protein BGX34_010593 [Mortierella sp. NVP85]
MVTTRNRSRNGLAGLSNPLELSSPNKTRRTRQTLSITQPTLEREGSETVESCSPTSTLESSSPPPELRDDLTKDCITEITHKTVEGPHSTDEESEQESREQEKREKSGPFPKEIQVNSERRKKADGNKDKGRGSVQNEDEVLENRSDRKDMNEDMSAQDEDDNDEDLDQLLVKAQHSLKRKAMFKEQANEPRFNFPKLETGLDTKNVYIRQQGTKAKIDMNTVVVVEKGNTSPKQKQQSTTLETCEINMNAHKVHVSKKQKQEEREKTAGKGWFDLPQQIMTPELKRDLQILKLRNVLDPKRFYKREDKGKAKFPKYFQIGTVIEGNTEFYSSRLTKKERATTITGEVMKDFAGREYYKRKFNEIQEAKQSGGKRFYKKGKGKQSKSWRAGK